MERRDKMKVLSKKKCDEILKRIAANEIIRIESGVVLEEAQEQVIENNVEIVYIVGGIKGLQKVINTIRGKKA